MITNYKGYNIDLFNFKEEDFCIEDVVLGLPNICRYGGRTDKFYSVAQHCVQLSKYLRKINKEHLCALALLHDAAEVYIGDIIIPIKSFFPNFLKYEDELTYKIYSKMCDPLYFEEYHKQFDVYDKNIVVSEMKLLNIWEREKHHCSYLVELNDLKIKSAWGPSKARFEYIKELKKVFPYIQINL